MAILLDTIHDSSTDFNASPRPPCQCLLNQSQRDSELGLCCSEGSQAGGTSLAPAVSLVLPIIYALICASGVLANGLVISVVLGCKQKVVSDIYILNLAVADLLFLVGMPFIIHQLLQEQGWIFGDFLCWAATTIDLNNQFSSVAIVTLLCIDRYWLWERRRKGDEVGEMESLSLGMRKQCDWVRRGWKLLENVGIGSGRLCLAGLALSFFHL